MKAAAPIALLVAMDEAGLIGSDGALPWRLPADLKRFRRLTMGHALVMGRRTFESIGRALDGRVNIVLSRDPGFQAPGVRRAGTLEAALVEARRRAAQIFVIGGAEVFRAALPRADRILLTRLHGRFTGDTFFPAFDAALWVETEREDHRAGPHDPCDYSFITLEPRIDAVGG